MKKVLITGLTGLVGSGLFSYLKDDESYEIYAICRESSDVGFIRDKCTIFYGSISDQSFLENILSSHHFDMLVHIANKALIVRFAELAKKYEISEVIMVSSTYACSVKHKDNNQLKLENKAEEVLKDYNCKYSFLRPTSIFGSRPNGIVDKNVSVFTRWVKKLWLFPLFKGGKATVCPVWGKDVGHAIYLMMVNINELNGKRLISSGDKKRTFKELVLEIGRLNNKKVRFIYIPGWFGFFVCHALYWISFKRIDKREQIDRIMEDKYFPTSQELIKLGYVSHDFDHSYKTYDVSQN